MTEPMDAAKAARAADRHLMRRAVKRLKLQPDLVIDVGVRDGTPPLYNAFPEAHFHLVDPQHGAEAELVHSPNSYTFHNIGLGAEVGEMTLYEQGGYSSMLQRTPLTHQDGAVERQVKITTLDLLIDGFDAGARLAVKLDTEGFEVEILRGLSRHAHRVEMIICEANVRDRFINSYSFAELIAEADARGFRFYNFLNVPKPRPNRFYDLMFLRSDNPLFSR